MPSEVNGRRAQTFWKAFKIWAAIMAVPGALGTFGKVVNCFRWGCPYGPSIPRTALWWIGAPGVILGGLGAAALALLIRPGQKWRAPLVGIVVGFACPVVIAIVLDIILPKNNDRMGLALFGFMFAMLGMFAGVMAGNAVSSPAKHSR